MARGTVYRKMAVIKMPKGSTINRATVTEMHTYVYVVANVSWSLELESLLHG